jgi:hypothetical protein
MKLKSGARILFLLLPLVFGNGCTNLLWQNTDWDCKPASNPNLRVFNAIQKHDLLVVYDEVSERTKAVHTRAYLLYQNQERVLLQKRPHFVSTNLVRNLAPVPLFHAPQPGTNIPEPLYIVAPQYDVTFTVCSNQTAGNSYSLPWYSDRVGQVERFFFSPVAITVDAALVGAVIYFGVLGGECP